MSLRTDQWKLNGSNAKRIHRDLSDSAQELGTLWEEITLAVVNGKSRKAIELLEEAQIQTDFIAQVTYLLAQRRADEALAIIEEAKGA